MHKVAFLDRDGVINHDYGYVHKKSSFKYIESAINAMKKLNLNGFKIIIVTNQAGIAKGHFTEDEYHNLTKWYVNDLKKKKVEIFDIFFCPFHIDSKIPKYKKDSFLRKPNPGMFFEAFSKHLIDKDSSFIVGDKISDIEASLAAGIQKNFLIANDAPKSGLLEKTKYVKSLSDAVNLVLKK